MCPNEPSTVAREVPAIEILRGPFGPVPPGQSAT